MTAKIVQAGAEHVGPVVKDLRVYDQTDVERVGLEVEETIRSAIRDSMFSWTGIKDDQVLCIFGVKCASLTSDEGYLWMVTTSLVEQHQFTFVRHSQLVVEALRHDFRRIHGMVDARYDRSIQWIKWLGFTIEPAVDFHGRKVRPFWMNGRWDQ